MFLFMVRQEGEGADGIFGKTDAACRGAFGPFTAHFLGESGTIRIIMGDKNLGKRNHATRFPPGKSGYKRKEFGEIVERSKRFAALRLEKLIKSKDEKVALRACEIMIELSGADGSGGKESGKSAAASAEKFKSSQEISNALQNLGAVGGVAGEVEKAHSDAGSDGGVGDEGGVQAAGALEAVGEGAGGGGGEGRWSDHRDHAASPRKIAPLQLVVPGVVPVSEPEEAGDHGGVRSGLRGVVGSEGEGHDGGPEVAD
jgi:hypothetical protein